MPNNLPGETEVKPDEATILKNLYCLIDNPNYAEDAMPLLTAYANWLRGFRVEAVVEDYHKENLAEAFTLLRDKGCTPAIETHLNREQRALLDLYCHNKEAEYSVLSQRRGGKELLCVIRVWKGDNFKAHVLWEFDSMAEINLQLAGARAYIASKGLTVI